MWANKDLGKNSLEGPGKIKGQWYVSISIKNVFFYKKVYGNLSLQFFLLVVKYVGGVENFGDSI